MRTIQEAHQLLQLLELTQKSIHQIIGEWAKESSTDSSETNKLGTSEKRKDTSSSLPSRELYEARRTLLAVTGKLVELVADPSERLLEVSSSYNEARCLHIAASLCIADMIDAAGENGASIESLSKQTGIEVAKLARIMKCLCSNHVFTETRENWFANNHISQALVHNEPLRAYIVMFSFDLYTASDSLPRTLLHSDFSHSYSVSETSFQKALGISKEQWNWLEEDISPADVQNGGPGKYPGCFGPEYTTAVAQIHNKDQTIKRPEHGIFGLAMLGGGKITGVAHLYDFPWSSLGKATVVDVGGGVGGFCLQLSHIYPELNFVVQDRAPVLQQAQDTVWPKENPSALDLGRVKFIPHSFFDENPIKGAEVYWLRYILHDWSDEYCVQILSAIKASMSSNSRILICDQVMNTTAGFDSLVPAPSPLPANYGYYTRYSHQRDITMMSIINGIKRTPAQFTQIIERAGLEMSRIWDCRSQVSLVECTLPRVKETNGVNGH